MQYVSKINRKYIQDKSQNEDNSYLQSKNLMRCGISNLSVTHKCYIDLQFYLFYGLFFYEIYSLSPCHCIIVCRTYKTVKIEFSRNLTPPPLSLFMNENTWSRLREDHREDSNCTVQYVQNIKENSASLKSEKKISCRMIRNRCSVQ